MELVNRNNEINFKNNIHDMRRIVTIKNFIIKIKFTINNSFLWIIIKIFKIIVNKFGSNNIIMWIID
jgi:hypothetical protein